MQAGGHQSAAEPPRVAIGSPRSDGSGISGRVSKDPKDREISGSTKTLNWDGLSLSTSNYNRILEFRMLFPEASLSELLISDYSCAWYKDILIQGRMYVTMECIYFHANLFTWTHKLQIRFKDVVSIEKRSLANFIPNSIEVATSSNKYYFCTLLQRNSTHRLLCRVWGILSEGPHEVLAKCSDTQNAESLPAPPLLSTPPSCTTIETDGAKSIVGDVSSSVHRGDGPAMYTGLSSCGKQQADHSHPAGLADTVDIHYTTQTPFNASEKSQAETKGFEDRIALGSKEAKLQLKGIMARIGEKLQSQVYISTWFERDESRPTRPPSPNVSGPSQEALPARLSDPGIHIKPSSQYDSHSVAKCMHAYPKNEGDSVLSLPNISGLSAEPGPDDKKSISDATRAQMLPTNTAYCGSSTGGAIPVPAEQDSGSHYDTLSSESCNPSEVTSKKDLSLKRHHKKVGPSSKKVEFPIKNIVKKMGEKVMPRSTLSLPSHASDANLVYGNRIDAASPSYTLEMISCPLVSESSRIRHSNEGRSSDNPVPRIPSPCTHDHYPTKVIDRTIPLTPDQLWMAWQSTKSLLINGVFKYTLEKSKDARDIEFSEWSPEDTNNPRMLTCADQDTAIPQASLSDISHGYARRLTYKIPIAGLAMNTTSECYIKSRIVDVEGNSKVCIGEESRIPGAPYGSLFTIHTMICISYVGPGSSYIKVRMLVKWSGYSLVKSLVNSSITSELRAFYSKFFDMLVDEFSSRLSSSESISFQEQASTPEIAQFRPSESSSNLVSKLSSLTVPTPCDCKCMNSAHTSPPTDFLHFHRHSECADATSSSDRTSRSLLSPSRKPCSLKTKLRESFMEILGGLATISVTAANFISRPVYALLPVVHLKLSSHTCMKEMPGSAPDKRGSRSMRTLGSTASYLNNIFITINIEFTAKSVAFVLLLAFYSLVWKN